MRGWRSEIYSRLLRALTQSNPHPLLVSLFTSVSAWHPSLLHSFSFRLSSWVNVVTGNIITLVIIDYDNGTVWLFHSSSIALDNVSSLLLSHPHAFHTDWLTEPPFIRYSLTWHPLLSCGNRGWIGGLYEATELTSGKHVHECHHWDLWLYAHPPNDTLMDTIEMVCI